MRQFLHGEPETRHHGQRPGRGGQRGNGALLPQRAQGAAGRVHDVFEVNRHAVF